MSGEVDPRCKGCDYSPQQRPVIDAESTTEVIGTVRIGDHTFDRSDDPIDVLKHAVANSVICSVCKGNHYFLKYPTPFKKFVELFSKNKSSGISRSPSADESMDGPGEPKQLLS